MDQRIKNKYNRVMSRVYSNSSPDVNSKSNVTRHEFVPSTNGAKRLLKVKSGIYYELPEVLHDYAPELDNNTKLQRAVFKKSPVVKPKKTLKSLKVERPNVLSTLKPRSYLPKNTYSGSRTHLRSESWTPATLMYSGDKDVGSFKSKYFSSVSDSKLQQLRDEIDTYREKGRMLDLKARMYKRCGIVLDDSGQVCSEKAVQAEIEAVYGHDLSNEAVMQSALMSFS